MVFVHGLGGKWQNWLENIPRVAQERRCIALDLPGFGQSEMPRERDLDLRATARSVDALCEQLGLGAVGDGRQLDGRLRRGRDRNPLSASGWSGCVLVSAAGITSAERCQPRRS